MPMRRETARGLSGPWARRWGAADGRWNAEVKVRQHFPLDAKTHVEVVTCFKVSAALAEAAGELWAKRWIDLNDADEAA